MLLEMNTILTCFFFKFTYKDSDKKSIPREQPSQNKKMKIADSVLLSLFMRDNEKCNISHALRVLNSKY